MFSTITAPGALSRNLTEPFKQIPGARIIADYGVTTETTTVIDEGSSNSLTITSAPILYTAAGGGPYFDLDGSADLLQIADASWTEPLLQATMLLIYYPDSAQVANLCGVFPGGSQDKMKLAIDASNNVVATVTADGSTAKAATQATGYTAAAWNMAALVFNPSTYVRCWANNNGTSNTTTIGAGLHNSTGVLAIGSVDAVPTAPLNGRVGLFAVYSCIIHDDHLALLWAHAKRFYR